MQSTLNELLTDLSPERRAHLEELLTTMPPLKKRPKPKLVCADGEIVGEAVVIVSDRDPNWWREPKAVLTNGVVTVRLPYARRI